ncbi:MAG TPA: SDR family NAD(P)-dependent oxidoreductase, partial [Spirochaetia bacterium]|nr:SDR family NAD(P)-dependent oxidoreductase [Spirochaetia bacterium]
TSLDVDRRIMEVNYFGLIDIAKRVAGYMLTRGNVRDRKHGSARGHIVVTSSLSGAFGMPYRSAYSASKHALRGFFESLRAEYGKHGLKVTIVMPGSIRTNISRSALLGDGTAYGQMDERLARGIPPEKAARKILKAVRKGKKEVVVAGFEGLLLFIRRYLPPLFYPIVEKVKD